MQQNNDINQFDIPLAKRIYLNNYNSILNENLFNKATKGIYELGSTLKLITAAIAFESNLIN